MQPNACNKAFVGNPSTNPFESTSMRKRATSQSEDCLFLNVYTPGSEVVATLGGGFPVVVSFTVEGVLKELQAISMAQI
ncbi:hypothetical protein BD769DRAFT_1675285 [Suillus cothurnatus]|nr:hypothetical protein BD769DRAFT_1675285 [Suillus cothurnatus]